MNQELYHMSVVDADTAKSFINENNLKQHDKVKTVVKTVGMFDKEKLLAIAQFCYPYDKDKSEIYTVQLLQLGKSIDSNIEDELFLSLIEYYIESYNPPDIFTYPVLFKDFSEDLVISVFNQNGDVLEWINTEITHYVYKITSPDSKKYYYGVRSFQKENATVEDCLNDNYMGSGGKLNKNNKFNNWKNKYLHSMRKEVIGRYKTKSEAYRIEGELISDKWKTDPNCLNSIGGGRSSYVKHVKDHFSEPIISFCDTHGETLHTINKKCLTCNVNKSIHRNKCHIHGDTVFRGRNCVKCYVKLAFSIKQCDTHGKSTFRKDKCVKCSTILNLSEKICSIHGKSLHQGDSCCSCVTAKAQSIQYCDEHGDTAFYGDKCRKCSAKTNTTKEHCNIHGNDSSFRGDLCVKCSVNGNILLKVCDIHGETKHQGDTCAKCSLIEITLGTCKIHGETSFTKNSCNTCRAEKSVSQKNCKIHGDVTHVGDKCRVCVNNAAVNKKDCEIHGFVKHQGDKCSSCSSMRTAHRLHHAKKHNPKCFICVDQ